MSTPLSSQGMDIEEKTNRPSPSHGAAQKTVAALLPGLPSAISTLTVDENSGDGPLMLYYGIDPQTLADNPEQMSAVLDFLARASRDIELSTGRAPTCVAVAA